MAALLLTLGRILHLQCRDAEASVLREVADEPARRRIVFSLRPPQTVHVRTLRSMLVWCGSIDWSGGCASLATISLAFLTASARLEEVDVGAAIGGDGHNKALCSHVPSHPLSSGPRPPLHARAGSSHGRMQTQRPRTEALLAYSLSYCR